MPDVFISYSRKDKAFAEELHKKLESAQLDVWRDLSDIQGGLDWRVEIKKAIEDANAFIFIISENSVRSTHCRQELAHAVINKKRLIPIVFKEVDRDLIPQELSSKQFIDFQPIGKEISTEAFNKLLIAIKTDWEWVNLHTALQRRALNWTKNKKSSFLSGIELTAAEEWLRSNTSSDITPTNEQIEYIQQSRKDVNRRLRITLLGVIIALVVAVALSIFSFIQRNNAISAEHVASTAQVKAEDALEVSRVRQLIAQSQFLQESDYFHASIIGIEAIRRSFSFQAYSNLLKLYLSSARINQLLWSHSKAVDNVKYSQDGKYFAMAGEDGKILLWDFNESDVAIPLIGHSGPVESIAFNPNNTRLLSCGIDHTLKLWDLEKKEVVSFYQIPEENHNIAEVIFSPDGQYVFLGSWNSNKITILNGDTLTYVMEFATETPSGIFEVLYDDGIIVIGGNDGKLYIYQIDQIDSTSPIKVSRLYDPIVISTSPITDLLYDPKNDALIVSCSGNPSISIFDVSQDLRYFNILGSGEPVSKLALDPSGGLLASGRVDGSIAIYNLSDGSYYMSPWKASSSFISGLEFSPTHDVIISSGNENSITIWKTWPPNIGREKLVQKWSKRVIFIPNSDYLVTGDMNGEITVYNEKNLEVVEKFGGHTNSVSCLATDMNGENLVSGGVDRIIIIRDGQTFEIRDQFSLNVPENEYIYKVAISQDNKYVAIILSNGQFSYWDITNKKALVENVLVNGNKTWEIQFSPDGEVLALGSNDGRILFLDPISLEILDVSEIAHNVQVDNLAFSADGDVIISSSYDGTVNTWKVEGLELYYTLTRQAWDTITDIALIPRGTILAIANSWGIELWDLNEDKTLAKLLFSAAISGEIVEFDDQGFYLAGVVENQGSVLVWDLSSEVLIEEICRTLGRNLDREEWEFYFWDDEYHETCPMW